MTYSCRYQIQLVVEAAAGGIALITVNASKRQKVIALYYPAWKACCRLMPEHRLFGDCITGGPAMLCDSALYRSDASGSVSRRLYTHDEVDVVKYLFKIITELVDVQLSWFYKPGTICHSVGCECVVTAGDLVFVFGNAGDSHNITFLSLVLVLCLSLRLYYNMFWWNFVYIFIA